MTEDPKIKRPELEAAEILAMIKGESGHVDPPAALVRATGTTYGDTQPGSSGGSASGFSYIAESCADNSTTNITLGAVAETIAIFIIYHAHTNNGGTHSREGGYALVFTDGTNASVVGWMRSYLNTGYCLDDDDGLGADVNSGSLRLNVHTKSLGAACDLRATFYTVEA